MAVTNAPAPVIALIGVAKTYRSGSLVVAALRDVTLAIDHREFVAITGPSGSGKSSLLMVMGGLERATAGRVEVLGTELGLLGYPLGFDLGLIGFGEGELDRLLTGDSKTGLTEDDDAPEDDQRLLTPVEPVVPRLESRFELHHRTPLTRSCRSCMLQIRGFFIRR